MDADEATDSRDTVDTVVAELEHLDGLRSAPPIDFADVDRQDAYSGIARVPNNDTPDDVIEGTARPIVVAQRRTASPQVGPDRSCSPRVRDPMVSGLNAEAVESAHEPIDARFYVKRKYLPYTTVDVSARKQMKSDEMECSSSSNTSCGGGSGDVWASGSLLTHAHDSLCDDDDQHEIEEVEETSDDVEQRQQWIQLFQKMSLGQQNSALRYFVHSLNDGHVRSLIHFIEPLFQKDFLSLLPGELALMIVSMLAPEDLVSAARVSRRWQRLCESDFMWRNKCREYGYTEIEQPSFRFRGGWVTQPANEQQGVEVFAHMASAEALTNRRERESMHGRCYESSAWKSLFLRKQRIIANWRSRKIQSSTVLKGHDEHVITCLQIHGGKIVTGSDDTTLRVWSVDDARPLFTLSGHMGGVWTSQISDDGKYIVSGSTDRTVRVWCGETGAHLHVLTGHTSTVRCMSLHGTTLVSGSRDQSLRVWDIVSGEHIRTLNGHLAAVRCVQFDGKRVVSGAYDFTVKVWDVDTGECIHTLSGHTNRVYSLLFDSERNLVVSGSLDTTIRVWDIARGTCTATLVGHTSLTSGMQLRGNVLVSCNADSDVRLWDIRDGGSCITRLHGANGHTSAITSLQLLDSGLLATSSDDGSVKLWDVDKGCFVRDLVKLTSGGQGGCIWRLKATDTLLVCAVGSRNSTEDTKLILLDFDASYP